ncbi:MAG: Ig family protein, partial [Verrucomicrobiaceae bacterium]|nr:Ig family protein [Verrucomicrobiaceae bacterium]
ATAFAELGVVDTKPKVINVLKGGTATLTVVTAGNALSYTWTKGGVSALAAPRITAGVKSLVIRTAAVDTDAGVYQCLVSQAGGASLPVLFTLNVIDSVPLITNASLPAGRVGQTYTPTQITFSSDANRTPVSFSALNLPAGLVCNPTTGLITGKPRAATKPIGNVTLRATNVKGTGILVLPITISDLVPNTAGIYTGVIGRDTNLNAGLGGRISVTVTGTGDYTGTLTLGLVGYPFKGVLETSSTTATSTAAPFKVTANATAQLTFTLDPAQARITAGQITTSTANVAFTAWRGTVPSNLRTGYYTFSLSPDPQLAGNESVPQGLGYGGFTVPATATAFNVAGVLADGAAYTSSSTLGPLGEAVVYQCLYTGGKGSILGELTVAPGSVVAPANTDSYLTGSLTWTRPHIVGRTYDPGFANLALAADGGRIDATKIGVMPMGFIEKADNASLTFTGAHVDTITPVPDLLFTLKKSGLFTLPGLPNHRTGFAFVASSGAFNGTFTQLTPARTGTYKGMLVNHQGTVQGDGWFTLPQLLPSLTTSPILSGAVKLEAK